MRIKRDRLVQHLQKIMCGKQITEAIFTGAFEANAITQDTRLFVSAPPLAGVEPLAEPIGLADLGKLAAALNVLKGSGNEAVEVDVRVEEYRLLVDEQHRGVLRMLTAAPKTIATRIEPETVRKLEDRFPQTEGIPLTRPLLEGIASTFSLFKAEEVELVVGKKGGLVRVGNSNADMAEFPAPELRGPVEYAVLFGRHLVDVLDVVTDLSTAALKLSGPNGFAAVIDGSYRYLLAPVNRGAEAKKTQEAAATAENESADEKPAKKKRKSSRAAAEV